MKKFDQGEIEFLADQSIIDQKNLLIEELYSRLSSNGKRFQKSYTQSFPQSKNSKVSRGENYKGYPYLILDYPRHFEQENIFALRTFFWWGHYISSSLHLKGKYLKEYSRKIESILEQADRSATKLFFSIGGDEWEHDLFSNNYSDQLDLKRMEHFEFLKICILLPMKEINNLDSFIKNSEKLFIKTLL